MWTSHSLRLRFHLLFWLSTEAEGTPRNIFLEKQHFRLTCLDLTFPRWEKVSLFSEQHFRY